ncbi:MAG TPA: flavin reductase family protein [Baekduia sp.]|uniref:flavin reductase family protein n=1 Tax=Baekduia sp. TaxID=2600305 RepID=UPI002D78C676|nr:flavin reductase family protein [Baekduia sp.]HET6509043.1 flavin reductase family protein [Baekduia sp.]
MQDLQGRRPLAADEFRDLIGHFATGVTVITTEHDGRRFGTTASAVTSLSLEPPMLVVCMHQQSETGRAIGRSRRFAVNILAEAHAGIAVRFAGKGPDRFDDVAVTAGAYGQPLLDDALATFECRVDRTTIGGTHTVFLAHAVTGAARPGAPLAYFRGQFGRLLADLPGT